MLLHCFRGLTKKRVHYRGKTIKGQQQKTRKRPPTMSADKTKKDYQWPPSSIPLRKEGMGGTVAERHQHDLRLYLCSSNPEVFMVYIIHRTYKGFFPSPIKVEPQRVKTPRIVSYDQFLSAVIDKCTSLQIMGPFFRHLVFLVIWLSFVA